MMELNEKIFEKAKQIAMKYPMPPGPVITKSDARAMMENASIQLIEGIVSKDTFTNWEIIRVNAATNILAGLAANARPEIAIDTDFDTLVAQSVQLADKLIEKLKEKQNEKAI